MTSDASIAVAMFAVADQDDAIDFYTNKLGWELKSDVGWGEGLNAGRWVEVAPPASQTRLALNPPMGGEPGGGAIGLETSDLDGEYARLSAVEGVQVAEPIGGEGPVPRMFSVGDPDGNWIWIVQAS